MPTRRLDREAVAEAVRGLPDWRRQNRTLTTAYVADTAAAALGLVAAIGALAEEADHHPDVDWRYRHVFVRCTTDAVGGFVTDRDVELAGRISALAADRDVRCEPALARDHEIAVDAVDPPALAAAWAAAFGYRVGPRQDEALDPFRRGPTVWFQQTATPADNRLHIDVHVADEVQDEVVAAVEAAGGRTLDPQQRPSFVVVADADGNRMCICTAH